MYYIIYFYALIRNLLPVRLRNPVMLSWLQCLAAPIIDLYNRFTDNRNNNLYYLAHNSQVVYLQAALNDTFDSSFRRIYIIDGSVLDPLYIFRIPENQPVWLGLNVEIGATTYPNPEPLYRRSETTYSGYQFIIMVPTAVVFDIDRLRALVDKYRLPSKNRYHVVVF